MIAKKKSKRSQKKIEGSVISIMGNEAEIYKTQISGDYYQFLMYAKSEQKSIRKSLKTIHRKEAISLARNQFFEILISCRYSSCVNDFRIDEYVSTVKRVH